MFFEYLFTDPQYYFWWLIIAIFSICLHELFHALAAYYEGDDTARQRGYFTMNPMTIMGPQLILLLLLIGLCWGHCPVNPSQFRHRYGAALVAFAGPLANLLLMVLFASGMLGVNQLAQMGLLAETPAINLQHFCALAAQGNAAFFLLNMIPLPPLDGSNIVASFFPSLQEPYERMGTSCYILILMLFWLPFGFSKAFWGTATLLSENCYNLLAGIVNTTL